MISYKKFMKHINKGKEKEKKGVCFEGLDGKARSAFQGVQGLCPGKLKTRAAGMERAKRVSVPKARVVSLSK